MTTKKPWTSSVFVGVDPSVENTAMVFLDIHGVMIHSFESSKQQSCGKDTRNTVAASIFRKLAIAEAISDSINEVLSWYAAPMLFIAYEDYAYDANNKAFSIGELGGILKAELYNYTNNIVYVAPKTLKRFATGNGAADKRILAQAARAADSSIQETASLDLTDAYWLARCAMAYYAPELAVQCETHPELIRIRLTEAKKLHSRKKVV